jgi:hypothetical protein
MENVDSWWFYDPLDLLLVYTLDKTGARLFIFYDAGASEKCVRNV